MQVLAPTDRLELIAQLKESIVSKKPTYIRIGKKGEPDLHNVDANLGIGKGNILREGNDGVIVGIGQFSAKL